MAVASGIVALLSDFGARDSFVGVVKGVMLREERGLTLVDICHEIEPQNVLQGAVQLASCVGYFPEGTVFWAVVDPGVGGVRRAVAVRGQRYFYVGPDNGLFDLCWESDPWSEAVEIDPALLTRTRPSTTFHGRDIFAPAAARLAAGVPLADLGRPLEVLNKLQVPANTVERGRGSSAVLYSDIFGNLIVNWKRERDGEIISVSFKGRDIPLVSTYSDVPEGALLAYWGSMGYLEIGANCASARDMLQAEALASISLALK